MGVYIKGIDKPKACCDCPFNIGICIVKVAVFGKERLHEPGEWWCPLVAVPDHGDLIDADDIPVYDDYEFPFDGIALKSMMKKMPVIIPAERSEE